MIDFSVKTSKLKLSIKPDARFWKATALNAAKTLRKRTESGEDVEGKAFKPYSKDYAEYRKEKGRSTKPNLTFTGRMLGSIRATGSRSHGKLALTGREGFKAYVNEENGREFFDLSDKEIDTVKDEVLDWLTKKNGLKR